MVNAGPPVFISTFGPNPMMVQVISSNFFGYFFMHSDDL